MTVATLIDVLSQQGSFNARRLRFGFPKLALDVLSPRARMFFVLFQDRDGLSLDDLVNDQWRSDPVLKRAYAALSADERLEAHLVIGFVVHETIHKIDMLISPFGVQYLALLLHEYLTMQDYVPQLLTRDDFASGLPILRSAGQAPPKAIDEDLMPLWLGIDAIVRKAMAWGDIGERHPPASEIRPGLPGLPPSGEYLGTGQTVEWVGVFKSFQSFRVSDKDRWYLRPTTILETKAVAGTLLHLLDFAPTEDDARRFYDAIYASRRDDLPKDYFFIVDTIAKASGFATFDVVMRESSRTTIRHMLLLSQSLSWFAMHASPVPQGDRSTTSLKGNPAVRMFVGLFLLPDAFRALRPEGGTIMGTEVLAYVESHAFFRDFGLIPVNDALEASRYAISRMVSMTHDFRNEQVGAHFRRVLGMMEPLFGQGRDGYSSLLGQPDDGNPRTGVKSDYEQELFYHDHEPSGAYAAWLAMREETLFSHREASPDLIARLKNHFPAPRSVG